MSTLCAYENYLRDRYVLGNPVHYAAGSSSPKPKSYDREGNEYTWSDEAGDYVRQVGGPGGGRTIRLSEVEKAEIEQPQTEQVDADSAQYGPKKKLRDGNVDGVKLSSNEFGSRNSLYRVRYPSTRDGVDYTEGLLYDSVMTEAPTNDRIGLSDSGWKNLVNLGVQTGVLDSEGKYTPLAQALASRDKNARGIAWVNLAYNNPAVKWFLSNFDDGMPHKKSEIVGRLVESGVSPSKASAIFSSLKSFFSVPEDSPLLPRVGRVTSDGSLKYSGLQSIDDYPGVVVYAISKALENGRSGRVRPLLTRGQVKVPVSDDKTSVAPLGLLTVVRDLYDVDDVQKILSGFSVNHDDVLTTTFTHGNDQVDFKAPNNKVLERILGVRKRDDSTSNPEARQHFDASGLGLPGKNDVALKPDVSENKDAAYFIRRDLESTPKSEAEEGVEEVDESSGASSSEAPQRDDDAALERKVKETLGKGEPLRKKATRLRAKAKDAALKGRKEEAAELRKQADEIEAEARKYIDEATNAGVELKNRRAEASQQPVPETKEPVKKPEVSNSSTPEQQPEPVAEAVQDQPAKPRPERWTPLKSKMNDDDRRVVENTRKRLNFGLADFAWRIANAKEKKDWQKVKELTVLAAKRYLEQARRAYRSHGGADALAAFDESLSGEGLTVGQVRDRVVDKFRQLALMNVADLHKYAGERLDEWETFSQGSELSSSKDKIALNHLLDKFHYDPNAVPYTPPEKGKIYEVPIDSLNLDPSRFQFKLNTNAQGVTDDLEGAEFDPMQAGIIHVWRDPDDGKDYVVNGHHRFNLAKNSGYDGKVNVRYIDADTADDAKAFGAVANIADSKGTATDVAEFIRTRGSDDIRTPAGKKIATKNKLLADGRVLSKLDDTIFRKLKNGSIDEKTARIIAAELPDDKEKQLQLFSDIERLGLDASQAQDRAWAYASIQGEKQQGSLFGDDAPMEYDVESRSKLIGEIRKVLGGAKRAAQAGGSSRNNEYWESQKLATNFDRDRAKQLSKSAGQTLDFFKDHIRLTGPMQNIIKEETDEYRKAIKSGKGAEKVVERAIERIKDVAQGGDGSVRRVEGLGFEYEDRLPSAKSEQTGQGVEAKGGREKQKPSRTPSESLRNGTTGEVLETGGADRLSDGGDGRDYASVIAEEAKKSDIPESRVREELSSSTDKGSKKTNSSSTSSPENMADWERELEEMREFKLLEDPILTQSNKRGSNPNAAQNAKTTKAPPVAPSGDKTVTSAQATSKGASQTPSFIHTPTIQQRIDAYLAEQRAKGRSIESLTAEDYARIFPDEDQRNNEGQTTVSKNKRGRPRIMRPDTDNTKKASKKKRKS